MPTLEVYVVAPEREVWSGPADMVVAKGVDGDVGILPGHAPMLLQLAVAPVRIREDERDKQVVLVEGGFLHVTSEGDRTRIDLLAERAVLPDEVDAAEARARADDLRRRFEEGDAEAQAELARALMHAEHGQG